MQEQIILKTKDDKKIYGVLDGENDNSKLVVIVHSLTGHKNEHHFYNAVKFFTKQGFSVFRFDLYTDEPDGRKLHECSIGTHSQDLNTVLSHFKDKYQNIYLIGHSLGGPVIMGANMEIASQIVLWDPSDRLNPKTDGEWYEYNKRLDTYIIKWGVHYIAGKELITEWENIDYKKWIEDCNVPLKVICAGEGVLKNKWKKFIDEFKVEHEYKVIDGAGHCFDECDKEEILFDETLTWFK
ncbi:alpha/beta hydrolase [Candidatus Parcubacteria bacterium]|nr:alpha/beta hydrolase [Candidatus Parcubacteria bacterium]